MAYQVRTPKGSYTGSSLEIISAMQQDRLFTDRHTADWMGEVASQVYTQTGKPVRIGSMNGFLEDLAAAGVIELQQLT